MLKYRISKSAFKSLCSELMAALTQESMDLNPVKSDRNGYSSSCWSLITPMALSTSWELTVPAKHFSFPLPRSWSWGKRTGALRKEIPKQKPEYRARQESHTLLLYWSLKQSTVAIWFTAISVYFFIFVLLLRFFFSYKPCNSPIQGCYLSHDGAVLLMQEKKIKDLLTIALWPAKYQQSIRTVRSWHKPQNKLFFPLEGVLKQYNIIRIWTKKLNVREKGVHLARENFGRRENKITKRAWSSARQKFSRGTKCCLQQPDEEEVLVEVSSWGVFSRGAHTENWNGNLEIQHSTNLLVLFLMSQRNAEKYS